jgi:hypothetical protein
MKKLAPYLTATFFFTIPVFAETNQIDLQNLTYESQNNTEAPSITVAEPPHPQLQPKTQKQDIKNKNNELTEEKNDSYYINTKNFFINSGIGFREFLMFLMLISSLFSLSLANRIFKQNNLNRVEDKFQSEVDDFWFKEIVTPKFITPVFICLEQSFSSFSKLTPSSDSEDIDTAVATLTNNVTLLHLSINILLGVPSGSDYASKTIEIFEHLEDEIQTCLYPDDPDDNDETDNLSDLSEAIIPEKSNINLNLDVRTIFTNTQVSFLLLVTQFRESLRVEIKNNQNTNK